MKSPPTFELKVAIIGNVSAGKTTVLNAFTRDKYGEVAMKRTTAAVNEFAVCSQKDWNLVEGDNPSDAKSILAEITQDNVELRASDQVHTKRFRIELEEPLCEMRKDTQLVLVDVPGLNEAHTSTKYWDYVKTHWETFDCVVVVMDGRQGVNTECQVSLLQCVKDNLLDKKDVPIIILFNKVDDPDDEEQAELVLEAQQEVEKVFGVSNRQKSLESLLRYHLDSQNSPGVQTDTGEARSNQEPHTFSPAFIPISAMKAFCFQTCSSMTLEKFKAVDGQLVDKLGRDYVGKRKWKRLSRDEQVEAAYEAVSDPEAYQEGLEDSNFHKFLKAMEVLVGGEAVQTRLILEQILFSLDRISWGPGVVDRLEGVYKQTVSLESDWSLVLDKPVKDAFWKLCDAHVSSCSNGCKNFEEVANELIKYKNFAASLGWEDEVNKAVARFEKCFFLWVDSKTCFDSNLVKDLKVVHDKVQEMWSLDETVNPSVLRLMKNLFMPLYEMLEMNELAEFQSTKTIDRVSSLADYLTEYGRFAAEVGWDETPFAVYWKLQELLRKQLKILCEAASRNFEPKQFHHLSPRAFSDLSTEGWIGVFRSILLLVHSKRFCVNFGSEIVWMQHLVDRYVLKVKYEDMKFSPMQHDSSGLSVTDAFGVHSQVLIVPSSIANLKHFGHVAWKYCEFEIDGGKA